MKFKLIFGIIIPILIIMVLVILGGLDIGFSVNKDYIDKLTFQDIFTADNQLKNYIKIADINIENDYFLGKRYQLPLLGVCLDDREGDFQRILAGNLQYNEGDYDNERGGFKYQAPYKAYPYYYTSSGAKNIQLKPNSKKSIQIFLQPSYNFGNKNPSQLLEQYGNYDSLLIFEIRNNYDTYYYCTNLDQETLDKAIIIPIEK